MKCKNCGLHKVEHPIEYWNGIRWIFCKKFIQAEDDENLKSAENLILSKLKTGKLLNQSKTESMKCPYGSKGNYVEEEDCHCFCCGTHKGKEKQGDDVIPIDSPEGQKALKEIIEMEKK